MNTLEKIQKRRAELKSALAELEIAERVLLSLDSTEPEQINTNGTEPDSASVSEAVPVPPVRGPFRRLSKPFTGKTIVESAAEILKHSDGDMHFAEIADAALARGYESNRATENAVESARQSFWAMMKRHPEKFEAAGKGRFRLKENPDD